MIFDENLLFDSHIQSIINKLNQMIGIIRRIFTYLNRSIFLHLYKALVRPQREYGHEIWFPRLKRQSVAIEKVQRRATKLLSELRPNVHGTYGNIIASFSKISTNTGRYDIGL